jgi:hypothetical protein
MELRNTGPATSWRATASHHGTTGFPFADRGLRCESGRTVGQTGAHGRPHAACGRSTSQGRRATRSSRGLPAKLIYARPCVAARLARYSRRSGTEDKMSSRPLSCNKRCPGTTWAVVWTADWPEHLFGASSWASWCRLPQTIAETRVPTVRRPSPGRRVAQPGLSRRIGACQTTGDSILSRDR